MTLDTTMKSAAEQPFRAGTASTLGEAFDFEAFAAIHGGTEISRVKSGATVYEQGEYADCLFYIRAGRVRIKVVSPEGKVAIMATLDADAVFGESCLIGEEIRVATASCLTDCILVRVARRTAMRAMATDSSLAEFLLARILHRVGRLRAMLISHLFDTSEQRLARILLALARGENGRHNEAVIETLDQEELAQMVGTTRGRVSHFMNKFRNLGYIDYNGRIAVYPSLANVLAAESGNREDASRAFDC
ncbi:MAG: Crp/Fnr family transcriptional regulator [Xanthobacteraceae bacterium]